MKNPDSRDIIIQQKFYQVNMANNGIAIRTTVRVKRHPVKIIINMRINVFIVTYPIIKRF